MPVFFGGSFLLLFPDRSIGSVPFYFLFPDSNVSSVPFYFLSGMSLVCPSISCFLTGVSSVPVYFLFPDRSVSYFVCALLFPVS